MRKIAPHSLIILFSLLYSNSSFTQTAKIDSLEAVLLIAKDTHKLPVLFNLIDIYEHSDLDKSQKYGELALEIARENEKPKYEIEALINIGISKLDKGNYFEALQDFKLALSIARNNKFVKEEIQALNEVGIIYYYISNYEQALKYYLEALRKAEKSDYIQGAISAQNNIAIIYSQYKNYDKAAEYFLRSLKIYEEKQDKSHIASTSVNLSILYTETKEYNKALEYINKAIPLFLEMREKIRLVAAYNNRGTIYKEQGKNILALKDFQKALKLGKETNFDSGQSSSFLNLGNYYLRLNRYTSAVEHFSKSAEIALKLGDKEILKNAYKGLAEANYRLNNSNEAYLFFNLFLTYKDSIYNEESQKQVSELEIKYETEKKEQRITFLEERSDFQKRIWLISLAGTIVVFLLGLYAFYVKQLSLKQKNLLLEKETQMDKLELEKKEAEAREKEAENQRLMEEMTANEEISQLRQEKYEEEITHKERMLSTNTLHIINKTEFIQNIREAIENAPVPKNPEITALFRTLLQEIDSNIDLDNEWDKFKVHFEDVHQDFFKRILDKFPDINSNDLRLCAYMRLNLDAKEISRILNISVNAVEKRRYRLRKKLQLEPEDNIFEFLSKI